MATQLADHLFEVSGYNAVTHVCNNLVSEEWLSAKLMIYSGD